MVNSVDSSVLEYRMAEAQVEMKPYTIPQPFVSGTMNAYYYAKGAQDLYAACVQKRNNSEIDTSTIYGIRRTFFDIEYIWRNGSKPTNIPGVLPGSSDKSK